MKPVLSILLIFLLHGCGRSTRSEAAKICTQASDSRHSLTLDNPGSAEQKETVSPASSPVPVSVMEFNISLLTN